jgi:hypothetical protein
MMTNGRTVLDGEVDSLARRAGIRLSLVGSGEAFMLGGGNTAADLVSPGACTGMPVPAPYQ